MVYHTSVVQQTVFGGIVFLSVFRTLYILHISSTKERIPAQSRSIIVRLFGSGAFMFAFGFFIWNLDNIFCDTVTRWRDTVGWPVAFLLEGLSRRRSLIWRHLTFLQGTPGGIS